MGLGKRRASPAEQEMNMKYDRLQLGLIRSMLEQAQKVLDTAETRERGFIASGFLSQAFSILNSFSADVSVAVRELPLAGHFDDTALEQRLANATAAEDAKALDKLADDAGITPHTILGPGGDFTQEIRS